MSKLKLKTLRFPEKPVFKLLFGAKPLWRLRLVANSIEMMGLIGAGNNPMVGMTVAVAVSIQEAADAGKF